MIHEKLVGVHQLSLPNTKKEALGHCQIASIFTLIFPGVDNETLSGNRKGEIGQSIHARERAARNVQLARFSKIESSNITFNANMRNGRIRPFRAFPQESRILMRAAMGQLNLSAWGHHHILKLARTIADLAASAEI